MSTPTENTNPESMDFDFLLNDRIQKIQQIAKEYDLEKNAYLSFSGGKDSCVLTALIDMALPSNKIPRVYINTGMEYLLQVRFVKECAEQDPRIQIIAPTKNVRETLERVGYPFKSKFHARQVHVIQKTGMTESTKKYFYPKANTPHSCPKILQYQATEKLDFPVSDYCCTEFKKKPIAEYETRSGRKVGIVGIRRGEKGTRENAQCLVFTGDSLHRFQPLAPCDEDFCNEFVKRFDIKLSPLYYEPYNFKRTGCKGCPFNVHLADDLRTLLEHFPSEFRACRSLWRPVYNEYERIGYRIKRGQFMIQNELFEDNK